MMNVGDQIRFADLPRERRIIFQFHKANYVLELSTQFAAGVTRTADGSWQKVGVCAVLDPDATCVVVDLVPQMVGHGTWEEDAPDDDPPSSPGRGMNT